MKKGLNNGLKKELKDGLVEGLPDKTTIKVSRELRDKLAEIGNKGETFEEVIFRLIRRAETERSAEITTGKTNVIQYKRKKEFVDLAVGMKKGNNSISFEKAGFEYEYNIPPKEEGEWELDIKIVKVFYNNKSYNPSEFFGVTNEKKYLSNEFIRIYFQLLVDVLYKEFGIPLWKRVPSLYDLSLMGFKSVYARYNLSHESFINDVEDVLRDFSEKTPDAKTRKQIESSIVGH